MALGYYFSGHLFDSWRDEVRQIVPKPLSRLEPLRDLQWMAGVVASTRTMMGQRGKRMILVLDDGSAQVEVTVFSELIDKHNDRLKEDQLLILHAKVSNDEYSGGVRVVADSILDLQLAREARARALRIRMNGNADADALRRALHPFRATPENGFSGTPVEIILERDTASCTVRLGQDWRVRLPDSLFQQLADWTSPDDVEVTY